MKSANPANLSATAGFQSLFWSIFLVSPSMTYYLTVEPLLSCRSDVSIGKDCEEPVKRYGRQLAECGVICSQWFLDRPPPGPADRDRCISPGPSENLRLPLSLRSVWHKVCRAQDRSVPHSGGRSRLPSCSPPERDHRPP